MYMGYIFKAMLANTFTKFGAFPMNFLHPNNVDGKMK